MAKYTVAIRGGFSDRNKIKEENTTIQTTKFDTRTRTALANITDIIIQGYFPNMECAHIISLEYIAEQKFMRSLLADVYNVIVDWSKYYHYSNVLSIIQDTIMTDDYDSVLTLIEYIARKSPKQRTDKFLYKNKMQTAESVYNLVFEQEYVGYRLINGQAQAITDENEIQAIQAATQNKYAEVKQHLDKALGFLSDRQTPDYANSIKESISAVERMCSIILGHATTLGDALKHLEDSGVNIHPALKGAFSKLYGYTSDASGIRHSGEIGGKDSTFDEAKFMLVSCCAFINYLTGVMAKRS